MTYPKFIKEIEDIRRDKVVSNTVKKRINEFEENFNGDNLLWFKELCYCLLTANFKAEACIKICEKEKKNDAFLNFSPAELSKFLKDNKHRFPNTRAKFIVEARKYRQNLKDIITKFENESDAREFIVKNIKGIGYKEASHFLRNTGYKNFAILDRHILRTLYENKIISEIPKHLNRTTYIKIENLMKIIAEGVKISPAELDLYLWYSKTGKVLK
ncbi:MAG: N-glycosylase [Candidatus Altiarchaeales archaeon HGW-Altiarchaeales-1]|nr:MAG: N-glycosylase [Candidatus Altiarchaeales archaeon HGW-Altiarchaeales-1]